MLYVSQFIKKPRVGFRDECKLSPAELLSAVSDPVTSDSGPEVRSGLPCLRQYLCPLARRYSAPPLACRGCGLEWPGN
ncbi:hypothetical protein [Pantoea ananatis]|uniref:hypothetical protein n=1 Tax=Pantoea ananas TaxID=553 RepID=UPI0039B986B3